MQQQTVPANKPKFSVAITTPAYQKLINNTLGDPKRAAKFTAAITSAVAVNPSLQECEASSVLAGALLGESLNLSPSPQLGQYYLVPFKDKKAGTSKAQFILGYKGYINLAKRSGCCTLINTMEVRAGEYLGKDSMSGEPRFHFIEDDEEREKLPIIGYMAFFEEVNGFKKSLYWSVEKMQKHADRYSAAFSLATYKKMQEGKIPESEMWKYSSYWYKDFDGMAQKTMLRQLISKWGTMSVDFQSALEADNKITALDLDKGEIIKVDEDITQEKPNDNGENPVVADEAPKETVSAENGSGTKQISIDNL